MGSLTFENHCWEGHCRPGIPVLRGRELHPKPRESQGSGKSDRTRHLLSTRACTDTHTCTRTYSERMSTHTGYTHTHAQTYTSAPQGFTRDALKGASSSRALLQPHNLCLQMTQSQLCGVLPKASNRDCCTWVKDGRRTRSKGG